ncbi:hypothetical protein K2Z83_28455 [Oscillochloris sp. ZM17-4]|uniref:hypothetical protein n=1 Tax=Oscillochloris sp. ZM17-4 TaxID=2866714 RepID=UPI001C737B48|nr:hypothetical protein [Oscillochloris sp. ZM17-4]MBX0331588.1 hypothetical protein [Oscillochloris sp. ZM17-4]
MSTTNWLTRTLIWERTQDAEHPYRTTADGATLTVRVNDFPEEPTVYTLLVDKVAAVGFSDWPDAWTRPARKTAGR